MSGLGLVAVCLSALAFGSTSINDEGYVSLHGDMPRHLMNGVFLFDVIRDRPFSGLATFVEYANLYYARYPALSLGHHPPLLPAAEVLVYALFGISIASARLVPLISFVVAAAFLYLLVAEIYGVGIAAMAAALFTTSPLVVSSAKTVMAEMPAVAFVVIAAYCLHRFCEKQQRRALVGFIVAVVLSLYAKQLAVFVVPAFYVTAVVRLGSKRMLQRDMLIATGLAVALTAPLVWLTLVLSPANVAATAAALQQRLDAGHLLRSALVPQLTLPVLGLAAAGLVRALARRDRRSLLFASWVATVMAGLFVAGRFEPDRYTIYWVPALCTLAASMAADWRHQRTRFIAAGCVVAALLGQGRVAARQHLPGAHGYEAAAEFVLRSDPGPTVLFSGDVDSGYFPFFVRKHDDDRRLVVMVAHKLFTTSLMRQVDVEARIQRPSEIYDRLQQLGTRYVVIEDRRSASPTLEWLRTEVHSARFVERTRVPIDTTDFRLRGVDVVVYEFLDATPAAKDAVLSMHLPLVGRSVSVPLVDLVERKYLR